MFIAHFGIGFAAKSVAPKISLGTTCLAAQFIDLLWPTLLLLGIERVDILYDGTRKPPLDFSYYPVSHSLLMVIMWAVLFAVIYFVLRRSRIAAIVLGLTVISHWLLDLIVHYPDLPLYPGDSPMLGFELWSYPLASLVLEFAVFFIGLWLYLHSTKPSDAIGKWALWSLVTLLAFIAIGNLYGDPPPSATAIAWVGQAQWLLIALGYWVDRHRVPHAITRHQSTSAT